MITKQEVVAYYADKTNGIHRQNTEAFFEMEAREKLFHMGGGQTLLDFGCGSADLLVYYARAFDQVTGVDISENMVTRARERMSRFGFPQAVLHQADEASVWALQPQSKFDVVTSAGVMQYLSEQQIEGFLHRARSRLQPGGRVALFDLVDPRLYWVFKYGLFPDRPYDLSALAGAAWLTVKVLLRKVLRRVARRSEDHIGNSHHPALLCRAAAAAGFECTIVSSMYYEYRYHALLTPRA